MKTPFLALTLSVVAFTASTALAGGPGEVPVKKADRYDDEDSSAEPQGEGFRNSLRRMGYRLTHTDRSEPGEDHHVRDSLRKTAKEIGYRATHTDHSEPGENHHVRDSLRNFAHEVTLHRPRAFHYLEMRKAKGGKVKILACEPMIERLANAQECRPLTKQPLDAKSLSLCAERNDQSKFARRIGRNLNKLMRRDFDFRRVDDSLPDVKGYAHFLNHCDSRYGSHSKEQPPARRQAASPKKEAAPQPRAIPEGEANPDFKPFDPEGGDEPVAVDQGGTL